jgi:hypothetical protein
MKLTPGPGRVAIAKGKLRSGKVLRHLILPMIVLAASPLLAAEVPAPLLTQAESRGIDALTAAILKAGFPDAAKAVVYSGELSVSATFDPKGPPPLPSSRSKMQMSVPNSTNMTYGYQFDGLHFKFPDGTWLISLNYRFKPKEGDKVNTDAASVINVADLTAAAAKEKPFDAEKDAVEWLKTVAPEHRARTKAGMNRLVPVLNYLRLDLDHLAPAVVLLARAGWNEAGALSLSISDQRAQKYWQMRPWSGPEFAFDPTGEYPKSEAEEQAWRKARPQFSPEPPETAFRRAMFRWSRVQITAESPEDVFLTPAVAGAIAKVTVDPKDPQGNGAKIDALLAGMRLPVTPPEGAGLAIRLQCWEARERKPRMVVGGGKPGAGGSISMSTSFIAPVPAYVPQKSDLDALVALLGDERPSRFWEFSGPHPVGDNALRALAILLKADPRALAGHPTDRPWTAAGRKAAAAAVQKWWKEKRKDYVEK